MCEKSKSVEQTRQEKPIRSGYAQKSEPAKLPNVIQD